MQAIAMLLFLLACAPIVVIIWMAVRIAASHRRIDELSSKVDRLELDLLRMKHQPAPTATPQPLAETPPLPGVRPVETSQTVEPPKPAAPFKPAVELIKAATPQFIAPRAALPPVIPPPAKVPPPTPCEPEPVAATIETATSHLPPPPPEPEKSSFEMRLGTFWLVRVGIIMLLTGFAFFANYAYHHIVGHLGPAGKICLLYLASGLLLGAGWWWQRRAAKASLKNYAQVLFAGGLAAVYFTTYAAHHIPALCVIGSPLVDGTLLLVWAGVIAWLADRRKSEIMAIFAIGLAFYSSVITRVGEFTLYSNLILTVAAVMFLVRNRWAGLSLASLLTSYAGYAFWRFLHDNGWHWASPDENLWLGAGFLLSYWLVFTAATFLSQSQQLSGLKRAAFLTLNNGAFFSLFLLTMLQVHTGGFWKFSLGYGSAMLALAALAQKILPGEPATKQSYLTQGLLLVTLGFIFKFTGLRLSLVLGAESVVLYVLGSQRPSLVMKCFAYAAAALATGWCVASLENFDSIGLFTGVGLGVLLLFNAVWAHRLDPGKNPQPLRPEPTVFILFAFACWLAVTWFNTTKDQLPLVLATEAVALTLSIYLLRVREITLLGQSFLVLAQLAWLNNFSAVTPPWWNPLAVIIMTIGLGHWWQYQKILATRREILVFYPALFALAAVAIGYVWLHPLVSAPAWLGLASLLALAVTFYGVATRAWPLAIGGQLFLVAGVWEFFRQVIMEKPDWYFPLAPMAALTALSLAAVGWFVNASKNHPEVRGPLLQTALVYRWVALAMSLFWIWQYVPDQEHVWCYTLAATVVFAVAIRWRNREALVGTAVYAIVAIAALWIRDDLAMDIYWPNLAALLALFVLQQILRHTPAGLLSGEQAHAAIIFTGGISLWRFLSCWSALLSSGFCVTMCWAGLAVLFFVAGILLRERFHRWFGLGVLAAAVGRVVLVDVWKQETIYRVLTFMVLGVALLAMGFIYNKYQETIKKWL